jgi:hypothetical protein
MEYNKDVPLLIENNMVANILNNNSDVQKIIILNTSNNKYNIRVYKNNKLINYCYESLLITTKYLHEKDNIESGTITTNYYNTGFKNNYIKMQQVFYIEDIVKDDIGLFRFYFQVVAKGLFEANELKSKMITESSENLYKYLTLKYPGLLKHISSKYIAEFMGITPEWLSKIRKNQK